MESRKSEVFCTQQAALPHARLNGQKGLVMVKEIQERLNSTRTATIPQDLPERP